MTFSVVARDDASGLLGVAVASCVLAVGTRVPLVRPGVGAVAVQAGGWLHWRQILLDLLERGLTAGQALDAIGGLDEERSAQVAVVGVTGPAAAFTGSRCDQPAGHLSVGPVSVQANTMASERAWDAMREAFEAADDLPSGLLAALAAAEHHGGDVRGRQSAALSVASLHHPEPRRGDAQDPTVDLRIDDSRAPIGDLQRLLRLHAAHQLLIQSGEQPNDQAAQHLRRSAARLAPDDPLCLPAAGIAAALAGHLAEGLDLLAEGLHANPQAIRWARWSARAAAPVNPAAAALLEALERL